MKRGPSGSSRKWLSPPYPQTLRDAIGFQDAPVPTPASQNTISRSQLMLMRAANLKFARCYSDRVIEVAQGDATKVNAALSPRPLFQFPASAAGRGFGGSIGPFATDPLFSFIPP